jgi:hypothetical protein
MNQKGTDARQRPRFQTRKSGTVAAVGDGGLFFPAADFATNAVVSEVEVFTQIFTDLLFDRKEESCHDSQR